MDLDEFNRQVYGQEMQQREGEEPFGWIQWKGTNACIDLHCVCGYMGHYDGDFLYTWRCPKCRQVYQLGQNVTMIPLNAEQVAYVEEHEPIIKSEEYDKEWDEESDEGEG